MCDGENESEVWSMDGDGGFYSDFLKLESAQEESFKTTKLKSILKRK